MSSMNWKLDDERAAFEAWATQDGTYDLRPEKWKVTSVAGEPYTGYVRPYLQDRTVHAFDGFIAARRIFAAPVAQPAAPVADLTDAQIDAGCMALLGCTLTELGDYSPALMDCYRNEVKKVHAAILATGGKS